MHSRNKDAKTSGPTPAYVLVEFWPHDADKEVPFLAKVLRARDDLPFGLTGYDVDVDGEAFPLAALNCKPANRAVLWAEADRLERQAKRYRELAAGIDDET